MSSVPTSYPDHTVLIPIPKQLSAFHSDDPRVSPVDLLMAHLRRMTGDPQLVPGDVVLPTEVSIRIGAKVRGWMRKTCGVKYGPDLDAAVGQHLRDRRPLAVPRRDRWSPKDMARALPVEKRAARIAAVVGGAR